MSLLNLKQKYAKHLYKDGVSIKNFVKGVSFFVQFPCFLKEDQHFFGAICQFLTK
jgi:hypothetical protein